MQITYLWDATSTVEAKRNQPSCNEQIRKFEREPSDDDEERRACEKPCPTDARAAIGRHERDRGTRFSQDEFFRDRRDDKTAQAECVPEDVLRVRSARRIRASLPGTLAEDNAARIRDFEDEVATHGWLWAAGPDFGGLGRVVVFWLGWMCASRCCARGSAAAVVVIAGDED